MPLFVHQRVIVIHIVQADNRIPPPTSAFANRLPTNPATPVKKTFMPPSLSAPRQCHPPLISSPPHLLITPYLPTSAPAHRASFRTHVSSPRHHGRSTNAASRSAPSPSTIARTAKMSSAMSGNEMAPGSATAVPRSTPRTTPADGDPRTPPPAAGGSPHSTPAAPAPRPASTRATARLRSAAPTA